MFGSESTERDIARSSQRLAIVSPVSTAIAPSDRNALSIVADQVTETALTLPADLTQPAWIEVGERFAAMQRGALQWWIGDWLDYGIAKFDLDIDQAADATGFDDRSLRSILQVARAFPAARRRETLSFWKHVEVVALDAETADRLLDECEENGWTHDELRAHVRPPKERAAIEVGTSLEVVRAVQRKIGKVFSTAVVEDDGRLLLDDGDGHRWRVTVTPA